MEPEPPCFEASVQMLHLSLVSYSSKRQELGKESKLLSDFLLSLPQGFKPWATLNIYTTTSCKSASSLPRVSGGHLQSPRGLKDNRVLSNKPACAEPSQFRQTRKLYHPSAES